MLHTLERDGALTTRRQTINGRSRVYYSVTPDGKGRLQTLTDQWTRLQHAIATMLEEPRNA